MRIQAGMLLAALSLTLAAAAQTEAQAKVTGNTEKLWKIEASGIGG